MKPADLDALCRVLAGVAGRRALNYSAMSLKKTPQTGELIEIEVNDVAR